MKTMLISVKDRLPELGRDDIPLIGYHLTGDQLEGVLVAFFHETKQFMHLKKGGDVDDENITVEFEDVTDWVDYWSLIPEWMLKENNI